MVAKKLYCADIYGTEFQKSSSWQGLTVGFEPQAGVAGRPTSAARNVRRTAHREVHLYLVISRSVLTLLYIWFQYTVIRSEQGKSVRMLFGSLDMVHREA